MTDRPDQRSRGHRLPAAALVAVLAPWGCAGVDVPSIPQARAAVASYVESGRYERDVERVTRRAGAYLARHAGSAAQPALVLDVDETALSNWPYQVQTGHCYNRETFATWADSLSAEAVEPVLELYRTARRNGVAVFFVSGRREPRREATETNLRQAGFDDFVELVLRPEEDERPSVVPFKSGARRGIEEQGWTIVVNVGDQRSDLDGGYAERAFKLPNPFYEIP